VRHSHPLHGRSSGILLGNMTGTMDVLACLDGEFHVMLHILKLHMESCCCLWCCQFKADFFYRNGYLAEYNPYRGRGFQLA
jgi:hypothetical protein